MCLKQELILISSPASSPSSYPGWMLVNILIGNINEDTTTFAIDTKLEETVNTLTERNGDSQRSIRLQLWVETNTRLKENWINRNSHEKNLDILIDSQPTVIQRCEPKELKHSYLVLRETQHPGKGIQVHFWPLLLSDSVEFGCAGSHV